MKTVQDIYTELGITSSTDLDTLLTKASNYKVISQSDINKIKALSVLPLGNNVKDKAEELKKRFTNIVLDEGAGQIHLLNVRTVLILEILDRLSNVKANKNGSATEDFNAKDVSAVKGTFSDTLKSTKEVVTPSAEIDNVKTDKVEPLGTADTSSVGDNGKEFDEGHFKNLFLANLFNYESTSLLEALITLDKYSSDYPVDVKAKAKFEKEVYFNDKVTTSHVVPKDNSNRNLGTVDYKWLNVYTSHLFATDVIHDLTPNGNYNNLDLGNASHKWRNGFIDNIISSIITVASAVVTNATMTNATITKGSVLQISEDNNIVNKTYVDNKISQELAKETNHIMFGNATLDDTTGRITIPYTLGGQSHSFVIDTNSEGMIKKQELKQDADGYYILITYYSGSTDTLRLDTLTYVYTGSENTYMTTTVENGVISVTPKPIYTEMADNESTRIANEEVRVENENARSTLFNSVVNAVDENRRLSSYKLTDNGNGTYTLDIADLVI